MIGVCSIQLSLSARPVSAGFRQRPPLVCVLTKQGQRLLSSIATTEQPSAAISLLRKFVASSSKHVALSTLSHLLSPSTSHPRLSSLAFPLYGIIEQESWFTWNSKLVADLISLLYKAERFDEAENLFGETVSKLGFKERDLCMFYCNLVDSHAKHMSERGVSDSCTRLKQLILDTSSVYVKQKGYESMIAGFCEIGLPDKAENLMEEMRENGLKPSAFELRTLVYGYGQMGLLEDMKRSVVRMEKEGFELDTVCYNMVLSSFGARNEFLDMLLWLKKMRNSGIPFSIRTYNSVLNACPTIILLLEDMKSLPLTVNELVDDLKTGEVDLVLELMKSDVLDQVMEWKSTELKLDMHGMHLSTAYLILLQWFKELKVRFDDGNHETPTEILVVCGSGKHSSKRGESPVKVLAKEMVTRMKCPLRVCGSGKHSSKRGESPVKVLAKEMVTRMKCPLRIDRKNIGCFIGKGKTFKDWLCNEDSNKNPAQIMKARV